MHQLVRYAQLGVRGPTLNKSSGSLEAIGSQAAGAQGGSLTKVLLVEDNEMNRDMLSRRLARKGYIVAIAKDGLEGVSKAARETPDIILMDMSLPEIDGWEATRRIKAAPETASIPIIALTAHAMASDREKALEAGCDDFDTKPVELSRLLGKMERLLPVS